jgi:hypothetical protein
MAFVMVLSYSRAIFLRFFLGAQLANFLRGHEAAFAAWGGVPRVALVDNLKSAVLERQGDAIRFNPTLLQFSGHWRFEVRPVAVARGNEKGRVERAIRFVRQSFFPARQYKDLDDLNHQAQAWCEGEAMDRPWSESATRKVRDAYLEERERLLPLAGTPFPTDERLEVSVGKTPYVRFDLNDYSVPHELTRRTLVVSADLEWVRILEGNTVVATHRRSFGKGEQIEDPKHIERLAAEKKEARKSRGMGRLCHAAPSSEALLEELAARGANLGSAVVKLLELLDTYGREDLEAAVREALESGVPHPHAVRQALERRRQSQGKLAALPLDLPQDPRLRDIVVKPHALDIYDQLKEEKDHGEVQSTSA